MNSFRSEFLDFEGKIHLNNAGIAPMTRVAHEAIVHWSHTLATQASLGRNSIVEVYSQSRNQIANFLHCRPTDLGFFQTCAVAISQLALGLKLSKGDQILTWEIEYPSNAYPWLEACRRSGAELIRIPCEDGTIRMERLLEAIGPSTKVVAISWVQFQSGAITDLTPLSRRCREVGALLAVDGIQGLGVLPFDFEKSGIDALCGGPHKWICGPLGLGFMALREEWQSRLRPLALGAFSYGTSEDPVDPSRPLRDGMARFEPGSPSFLPVLGMAASMIAIQKNEKSIAALAQQHALKLRDGFRALGAKLLGEGNLSPIVTLQHERQKQLTQAFDRRGVSYASRGGGIRLSPHGFNTEEEMEEVLAIAASQLQ